MGVDQSDDFQSYGGGLMLVAFGCALGQEVTGGGEMRLETCRGQVIKGLACEVKGFGFYFIDRGTIDIK